MAILRSTCRDFRGPIQSHLSHRLRITLRPYLTGNRLLNFLKLLKWSEGIVSGSTALSFFLGRTPWKPGDLNIYTPQSKGTFIISFFLADGFTVDMCQNSNDPASTDKPSLFGSGIQQLTVLKKGEFRIGVSESLGSSAFATISYFHSTSLMNGITARGFFSAYPVLTTNFKAITNRLSFYPRPSTDTVTKIAIDKYRSRGFTIYNPEEIDSVHPRVGHRCGECPSCPHTVRHTRDRGCLNLPIYFGEGDGKEEEKSHLSSVLPIRDVVWFLGGRWCQRRTVLMKPFETHHF